ncbi:nucleolar protein 12-domain-containing protein [Boeremia exigua]|uniref:nucleolar protein 12-domain-containing protein n=1 Tax=Boeremia exigua TaxID=749465 RepID=UPI001E8D045F|nr:nucleolar protein 12-domain-containing protein [Boeremia exigua]KAH6612505.1 nucleolar protein 12-domain-containing protein [Boeremia exigua]
MRSAPPPNKKRKIKTVHEEKIDFDPAAREEYLTGFHKRKVARRKFAEEEAAKKDKEEKLRARKELRQQRKTDLEKHVSETNRLMRLANGDIPSASENDSDSETEDPATGEPTFTGFDDPINLADEYIDEDKYTTVTVESIGITRSGFSRPGEAEALAAADRAKGEEALKTKRVWTKERPRSERPKKKKVKFRYETKSERKMERMKQGLKKKKQAERRSKDKEEK